MTKTQPQPTKARPPVVPSRPTTDAAPFLAEGLAYIRNRFYGDAEAAKFFKDRRLLLYHVLLWPARWYDERFLAVSLERYRALFLSTEPRSPGLLVEAANHCTGTIRNPVAYLAHVVQAHFKIHGERLGDEAKAQAALANPLARAIGALGQPVTQAALQAAAVAELARARAVLGGALRDGRQKKAAARAAEARPASGQQELFG